MSKKLSSLFKKEQSLANLDFCAFSELLLKFFLTVFPLFMPKREFLSLLFAQLLFFKEGWEQFAPVARYKRATVSDSLTVLMTKERREQFALIHKRIAPLLFRSQKTSDSLEKQMSEFLTLMQCSTRNVLDNCLLE